MGDLITKEQLRRHLGYRPEFVEDDEQLDVAVTAAEAAVHDYCGRVFTVDSSDTTRIYPGSYMVPCDDVSAPGSATVEVSGDRETWTAYADTYWWDADGPRRGAVQDGWPATCLYFETTPDYWVRITALHGWAAVPEAVTQATKLVAAQLLSRRHSPNGIEGFGEYGAVRASRYLDSHAQLLLRRYRKANQFAGIA